MRCQRIGSCGIHIGTDETDQCHPHHAPSAIEGKRQPRGKGKDKINDDAFFHLPGRYPSLCAGPARSETVLPVVALFKVTDVIDEIGGYLHEDGEKHAQQRGNGTEMPRPCGQSAAHRHRSQRRRQRLRTACQHPCIQRILANVIFHHICSRGHPA